ncbi:hypothetical protein AQUCO_03000095v1 [Aquilegia coerulea]|uniref:Uncharacterized protein n=1 Tax=Aquilegia coerulea TaxID=218851 RepID=A0A2G5D172_AQUCA|nr:hypothetical protein AQUCO_03000095v1 [Aquilegia coerulea]
MQCNVAALLHITWTANLPSNQRQHRTPVAFVQKTRGDAMDTGTVFCDQCKDGHSSLFDYPLSGMKVRVTCDSMEKEETTNWLGSYTVSFEGSPDLSGCYAHLLEDGQGSTNCGAVAGPAQQPMKHGHGHRTPTRHDTDTPTPVEAAAMEDEEKRIEKDEEQQREKVEDEERRVQDVSVSDTCRTPIFGMEMYAVDSLLSQPARPMSICPAVHPPPSPVGAVPSPRLPSSPVGVVPRLPSPVGGLPRPVMPPSPPAPQGQSHPYTSFRLQPAHMRFGQGQSTDATGHWCSQIQR